MISPEFQWLSGRTAEQSMAVYRELALSDVAVRKKSIVWPCLEPQMKTVAKLVQTRLQHRSASEQLQTGEGIGALVAQTIVWETGDMCRLPTVGQSASYSRWVQSTNISHRQRQGQGNVNNGNP